MLPGDSPAAWPYPNPVIHHCGNQKSDAKFDGMQLDKESPQQKTRPTHKHTYKLTYKHTYKTKQKQYIQTYIQAYT